MINRYGLLRIQVACAAGVLLSAPLNGLADGADVDLPLTWASGFETGNLDFWNVSGNAPEVTTSVAREGRYAIKSTVDRSFAKSPGRTEVTLTNYEPPVFRQDTWYGFSVYLPPGFQPDSQWEVVAQWHDIPDPGEDYRNPILAIWTTNGKWSISNLWDDKAFTPKSTTGNGWDYGGKWNYDLGAYETGKWTDWVVRVRWSYGTDGILQMWKDGVLVVDQQNKPNAFNDQKSPYFKMGMYKGWSSTPGPITRREVYHDAFRMAGSAAGYKDVAPGGGVGVNKPEEPAAARVR